ncbi:MAG: nickel pincer cofactor biosynthesis protein LarC [Chloroflexota bacterium]|nr:nickel pincer cofactor biosynthesis protein LarC [Chloroflexota bacterium]
MARAVYFDCFSGAAGDMLLGALLDAGVSPDELRAGLRSLPVGGWRLDVEAVRQHALGGTRARVKLLEPDQPHRGLADVLRIVRAGALPHPVVERAAQVFERLAQVEASIHATTVDAVEFHEVGAIDAIVDVVGVVLALHLLEVDWSQVLCSGLPLGSGWVTTQHGRLPVPAPATLELIRLGGVPTRPDPSQEHTGELTTPTAAALLSVLAAFGSDTTRLGRLERVGYGFGTREPPWPNAVRLLVGEPSPSSLGLVRERVVEIQTNLDDCSPEELAFAMERLLEAGALDVAFSPLQMKKNRPGVLVRVLARPDDGQRLAELVLLNTSALGARVQTIERVIARRSQRLVDTPWGSVRVKVKHLGGREIVSPEYEDCASVARAADVPLSRVYAAARLEGAAELRG